MRWLEFHIDDERRMCGTYTVEINAQTPKWCSIKGLLCEYFSSVVKKWFYLWLFFFFVRRNCHKQFVRSWGFRTVKLQRQIQTLVKMKMLAPLVPHLHLRVTPCPSSLLPVKPKTPAQHRQYHPQRPAD